MATWKGPIEFLGLFLKPQLHGSGDDVAQLYVGHTHPKATCKDGPQGNSLRGISSGEIQSMWLGEGGNAELSTSKYPHTSIPLLLPPAILLLPCGFVLDVSSSSLFLST